MTVETRLENITLYYREGTSDKVYQASIVQATGGYVVNFAFGRRGSTMNTGTKTSAAVGAAEAERIYHKLVTEKMAKGYTEGADGTPYQNSEKAERISGLLPQLLNAVDEAEAERLVTDPAWGMQEKKNGVRLLLRKKGEAVFGSNRKGLLIALPETLTEDALDIPGDYVFDGELVGETLYVFDALAVNGDAILHEPFYRRYIKMLNELNSRKDGLTEHVRPLPCYTTLPNKAEIFQNLKGENAEGVVLKRMDAPYTPGRPASGGTQLKHKFYATLSAVVDRVSAGKRSVALRLLNHHDWLNIGNVTIPPNHAIPVAGAVVEVRYLYAYPGGSLFQPVYLGERTDIDPEECLTAQLKLKPCPRETESGGDEEGAT